MPCKADNTRENILKSAQAEFLKTGFSGASLRKIAANAGVTTGALYRHFVDKSDLFDVLVSPCFNEFMQMLRSAGEKPSQEIEMFDQEDSWSSSEQTLIAWTEYIYDHFDAFKLLLSAAEKTSYERFTHSLIEMEVDMTLSFIHRAREKGYTVNEVSPEEIHIFVNAQISSFFEMVLHDIPRDRALQRTKSIFRFFTAGWNALFCGEQALDECCR